MRLPKSCTVRLVRSRKRHTLPLTHGQHCALTVVCRHWLLSALCPPNGCLSCCTFCTRTEAFVLVTASAHRCHILPKRLHANHPPTTDSCVTGHMKRDDGQDLVELVTSAAESSDAADEDCYDYSAFHAYVLMNWVGLCYEQ